MSAFTLAQVREIVRESGRPNTEKVLENGTLYIELDTGDGFSSWQFKDGRFCTSAYVSYDARASAKRIIAEALGNTSTDVADAIALRNRGMPASVVCGNCGSYRTVGVEYHPFMVQRCPVCGDDEYDLTEVGGGP